MMFRSAEPLKAGEAEPLKKDKHQKNDIPPCGAEVVFDVSRKFFREAEKNTLAKQGEISLKKQRNSNKVPLRSQYSISSAVLVNRKKSHLFHAGNSRQEWGQGKVAAQGP
jgi:hypothetical protein